MSIEEPPASRQFVPGRLYLSSSGRSVRWPSVKTPRGLEAWLQREVRAEIAAVPALEHLQGWFDDKPGKWPRALVDSAFDVLFYCGGLL